MASYKYSAEDLKVPAREAQQALDSFVDQFAPDDAEDVNLAAKVDRARLALDRLTYMLAHNARLEEHEQQGDAATPLQLPY